MNELVNQPAGRRKWIGIRQARSNVIERHAVAAHNAVATMVPTAAAGVAAALAAIAEVAVPEAEAFEAVVAGASGTVGRFRSGVTSRHAGRRLHTGRYQHELDTGSLPASRFDEPIRTTLRKLIGSVWRTLKL